MKDFFKFMFASCLGGVLLIVSSVLLVATCNAFKSDKTSVADDSVLEIDLDSAVPELTGNTESGGTKIFEEKAVGLSDYKRMLAHAKTDPKIRGVFMRSRSLAMGFSTASQLRAALEDFKASGKFVYAFADYYSQGAYYMASVANSIWVSPTGAIDFRGLAFDTPFLKDGLDRLGVKMQVYYAGKFKSATESLRLNAASPENKEQTRVYLEDILGQMLADVSRTRGIELGELRNISNNFLARSANDAVRLRLVDSIGYLDQAIASMNQKMGKGDLDKIKLVSVSDYLNSFDKNLGSGSDKIAVVYAEGSIGDGNGKEGGSIEGNYYAQVIRNIRRDKNVKAIVLRVNSGGGSAIGSDMIRRELEMARAEGKSVMVSMGDYAASGGYYISLASDSIFAQSNTLTGSIGVFSVIPCFQKMLKDKLGVTFDTIKTGKYSALMSTMREFSADESLILQAQTDSIYEDFLRKVAHSRHKTRDQIHEIAQGRVWTGRTAVQNGLVDRIGTLDDAIAAAASKSGLKKYRIKEYPEKGEPIQKFLDNLTGKKEKGSSIETQMTANMREQMLREELGQFYETYAQIRNLQKMNGVQARLLFMPSQRW